MKQKIILILIMLMIVPGLTVAAQSISDMEQRRREIQRDAHEARQELSGTRQEMEELEGEIYIMDRALNEATVQLEIIEDRLEATKIELDETEEALEQARKDRDEHFERFKTRLRVMYIHGPVGYLEVVLQATSFSDFLTRLEHMNTIARNDREIAERLNEAEELVAYQVEETHRLMNSVSALQLMQADRVADLYRVLDQKYDFMNHLLEDAYQYEAIIRQLEQAEHDISGEIQRAQEAAEAQRRAAAAAEAARRAAQLTRPSGGRMQWPVPGHYRISSPYGNRTHPIRRTPEFHSGIDIPAPNGTNIVAAADGIVIISGWRGGYGNTIVIDHGGGLSTLYGHNSRNIATEGQFVYAGDVIARVGSTGVSTGPHLHFEVRHNGRHVNPNPYLGLR